MDDRKEFLWRRNRRRRRQRNAIFALIVVCSVIFGTTFITHSASHQAPENAQETAAAPAEKSVKKQKATATPKAEKKQKAKTTPKPEGPMIALTFDDGPGPYTGRLLDCLEQNHAKATFFMLGSLVSSYPEEIRRMDALGCEIGNHSYNHANFSRLNPVDVQIQIGQTNELLIGIIGRGASVARPPYGSYNDTILANMGMPAILWNIDTLDWKTRDPQATIDAVLGKAKEGDIILMHDIHEPTVAAAEMLIPALIEQGYQLVTVSEMAATKGITLMPGAAYNSLP